MKRNLLLVCGLFCVVLATIGIFVPLLPTTPFLILASVCFLKSSEKAYQWLITNRFYGRYIAGWIEKKGIPMRVKLFSLVLLWTGIGVSFFYGTENMWIRTVLVIVLFAVSLHILLIKKSGE
jgi:uncharacterized protein